jgi:hypothetical protein
MRISHLRVSLYMGAFCLLVTPLPAQQTSNPASDPALITKMTLESFQQRVQVLGFSPTRGNTDGKQDTYFTFMAEGRKVGGLIVNPAVVELFISYTDGGTPEDLNEWNRTHFGTAAFVDQKGNAVLRSDLVLDGGVTGQNVDSFITRFRDAASAYARFIIEHKKKS